ncbi:MAG: succinylglutamate desuccinylase/aspartoacylase family protein [candidate division SR1 bacterium]|nr:succinylglutamate desuccinylase/aspartoacylase family protein [candidate division SR1 bacterium]
MPLRATNNHNSFALYKYFKDNQNDVIPYIINISSQNLGKHIAFVIGAHGNEPAAIMAAQKLHKKLLEKPELLKSGKISFVLGNPEALKRDQKFVYSDLNQSFTPKVTNGSESRRVAELSEYFKTNTEIDLFLDIYTSTKNKPRVVFYVSNNFDDLKLISKVSRFGLYVNINAEMFPGNLILESHKNSIPSYAISFGNENINRSISVTFDMMVSALEKNDIIEKNSIEKEELLQTPHYIDIYYPRESIKVSEDFKFMNDDIKTGDHLKKGEMYASYKNGFHIAHEDSFVFLLTKKIKRDNLGFLCKKYTLVTNESPTEEKK